MMFTKWDYRLIFSQSACFGLAIVFWLTALLFDPAIWPARFFAVSFAVLTTALTVRMSRRSRLRANNE